MAINIFGGKANGVVCKLTTLATDIFDIGDILIAYEIGSNKSWIPGRSINGFNTFVAEQAYYIIGNSTNLDKEFYFVPRIVTPPTGSFRFVEQTDIDVYPQMNFGDYIIDGPNTGVGIYDYPPQLGPCAKIFIKGGTYEYIFIDLINTEGSPNCPIVITNYDGQVVSGTAQVYGANIRFTGKYDILGKTGDSGYTGWDNLGTTTCLTGKFGFKIGAGYNDTVSTALQFNQSKGQVGIRTSVSNIEVDNVEVGNGGYAGIAFKTDDSAAMNMDNIRIHDNYIHDTGGEGIYLGSTGVDPQHQFTGLRIYDNLITRTGLNSFQTGQLQDDCRIYNNTIICPSMDWAQAFGLYQDQSTQYQMRKNGTSIYNNLVVGGGEAFINYFMSSKTGLTQDSSLTLFQNNVFLYLRNSYAGYLNFKGIDPVNVTFDNNIFGKYNRTQYEILFPNQFTTNYEILVDTLNSNGTIRFTNNILDNSNTKGSTFIKLNETANISTVESGNTITTLPVPEFANFMDLPSSYDYSKLENWTNLMGLNYDPTGNNSGQVRNYALNDYVVYRGRMYKSLHDNNAGNQPIGSTDSHWQLIVFSTGSSTCIPEDGRLVLGSYYANKGVGITKYATGVGTTTTTTTSSTSSTTTTTTIPPTVTSNDLFTSIFDNGDNTFSLKYAQNRNELTTDSKFRVVAIGSSTLAGTGASSPSNSTSGVIQTWLNLNTNFGKFIPLALGGSTSSVFLTTGNPVLNVDAAISTKPSCAFICLPSNDIVDAGLSPAQFVTNLQIIFNRFREYGIPCFISTTQPRDSATTGQQTSLKDAADLIRTNFPTEFVIDVFDLLRDTGAGTDAVINPTYAVGDGIHLNDTGHALLASTFTTKLNAYYQNQSFTEYSVESSTSPTTGFTVFDTVVGGTNVSKIYNRSSNTTYYYKVRAKKIDTTYTNYSNVVSMSQPYESGTVDQVIEISFKNGNDTLSPSPWNHWVGATTGDTVIGTNISNLINTSSVSTGVSAIVTKKFSSVLQGVGGVGGIYPNSVSISSWSASSAFNDYSQIKFTGLSSINTYKIEILTSYGNSNNPALSVRNNSDFNKRDFENSSNYPTNSDGNNSRLITLYGNVPNSSGEITLDFFPLIYGLGSVAAIVISRYTNPNPPATTTTSSTTTTTTTAPPTTTTTTTNPVGTSGTINVNLYGGTNPYNDAAWNNWNIGSEISPLGFTNLKYTNGSSSNINLAWDASGTFDGISDNGGSYVGSTEWPSQVLRYAAYTFGTGFGFGSTDRFVISGLNNLDTYTIQLIGSRSTTGRSTQFRCEGDIITDSALLTTDNNSTNIIEFTNVVPASGQITISFISSITGYINAFKIIVNSGGTTTTTSSTTTTSTSSTSSTTTTSTTPNPNAVGNIFIDNVDIGNGFTRQAYMRLPADYNSTSTNYPLLVFLHGAGEALDGGSSGIGIAKLYGNANRGVGYFMNTGTVFNFTNPSDGLVYKFIVVCPQASTWSTTAGQLDYLLADIQNRYRIDTSRIYLTGLSAGGQGIVEYAMNLDNGVANPTDYTPASIVPMSAAIATPTNTTVAPIVSKNMWIWGFGSMTDIHGVQTSTLVDTLNGLTNPDRGRFTPYSGGHCCWGTFYNPTYKENIVPQSGGAAVPMNIYEWMLQFPFTGTTTTTTTTTTSSTTTTTTTLPPTTTTTTSSTTTTTTLPTSQRVLIDLGGDGVADNGWTDNGMKTPDNAAGTVGQAVDGKYWNNIVSGVAGTLSSNLKNILNVSANVSLSIDKLPSGTWASPTDFSMNYGGPSITINDYPTTAVFDNMYFHSSAGIVSLTFNIPSGKKASIKFWGSRSTSPRSLDFRLAGGTWSSYNMANNTDYNNGITFNNVTGIQTIEVRTSAGVDFGHISIIDMIIDDTDNIVINNTSTDVSVTSFQLDTVSVPGVYAEPGQSTSHHMLLDSSVDLSMLWINTLTTQQVCVIDTKGTANICATVTDTLPYVLTGLDMTGQLPLTINISDV